MDKVDRIETVSLVGLGGIGSIYLSIISEAIPMENIRVIAGGARGARYRKNGVAVNGRTFRFPVCDPNDMVAPADLLIFAVKQNQLDEAIRDARGHLGPDTIVLSFLNGVTSEQIIAEAYGTEHVLYSTVVRTNAIRTGDDTVFTELGVIPFGEAVNRKGAYSRKVERVAEFFTRAGIPHDIPEDMIRALWKKLISNVAGNQISAIFRCRNSVIRDVASIKALAVAAAKEVVEVSKAAGTGLIDEDLCGFTETLDRIDPDGKTSMLQDIEAGRRTEVNILGGTVVEMAARHNLHVPVNEMLVRLIRAFEDMAELEAKRT
jgi:2-dehydropantoate 2-reductase